VRLLLVTNDYPPKRGGIQQYLGNLVDAFDGEVLVLAPADGPAEATTRGESVVRRHRRRFLWPMPGVRRWITSHAEQFAPDLVLFGAPYPLAWMTPRLRRDLDVPVGILCHGAEITVPAIIPGLRTVMRRSLRAADHIFAVSRFTTRRVEALADGTATYVGSGVDTAAFSPDGTRPDPSAAIVVGCVSRFVPRKGQARMLKALARLRKRGVDAEALMVGSGRKEASLRRLAGRLGVPARFEVDVPWERLPSLYRQMTVFCMPCRSRWFGLEIEGLGIVYLEAAATGLPVLAGASGGAPETVVPGRTGFVVHSISDVVEALEMLIGDPERAEEMGAAGRGYVSSSYSWRLAADRIARSVGG
jgi:phosphatidylinositol alpha-1,6-mannosyltransferase